MQEPGDDYDWFNDDYNLSNSHPPAPGYCGESQHENATTPTPVKMDVDVIGGSVHHMGQMEPSSGGTVDVSVMLERPARNLLPVLLQNVETKKPVEQPADVPGLFFVDTVGGVPPVSTVATRLFAAYAAARSAGLARDATALGSSSTSLDTSAVPGAYYAATAGEATPFPLEPTQILHSSPPLQSPKKSKIGKNRTKKLKRLAAEQTRLPAPTYRFFQPAPKIFKRAVVLFPPGVHLPPVGLTPAARQDYYYAHVRKAQEERITTLYPGIPVHVLLILDCIENGTLVAVYDEHGKLSSFLGRPGHGNTLNAQDTLNAREKDDILQYCGEQKYEELLEIMKNRAFEHVFESSFPLAMHQSAPARRTRYILAEEQPQTYRLVPEAAVRKAISRKFNTRLERACFQQTPVKPGYFFVMKGLNSDYIIELAAKLTKEAESIVYVVFSGWTKKRGIQVPVVILDQVEELERAREEEARGSKNLGALLEVDVGRNVRCWDEDCS